MPLAFKTINKDIVPFGFFNVKTDLLILDQYFFFASDFCKDLIKISENRRSDHLISSFFKIKDRNDIGDFMGAQLGISFEGFMGELYTSYPFPEKRKDFRQNTHGHLIRPNVEPIIAKWGVRKNIELLINHELAQVRIGEYHFTKSVFHDLIRYLWRGGLPKWQSEGRPGYVIEMKNRLQESQNRIFNGLSFIDDEDDEVF